MRPAEMPDTVVSTSCNDVDDALMLVFLLGTKEVLDGERRDAGRDVGSGNEAGDLCRLPLWDSWIMTKKSLISAGCV